MNLSIEHFILVSGPDLATCEHHVRLYFEKSQLVRYDSIEIDHSHCMNATAPQFEKRIKQGVNSNREIISDLLSKLNSEGCKNLQDILTIPQGFQSKLLHTMSHLLDGFFGIDSTFYDLDEISHWITDSRRKQITESPETCWLMRINAQSVYEQGFEKIND
jgi:hypothetical protein